MTGIVGGTYVLDDCAIPRVLRPLWLVVGVCNPPEEELDKKNCTWENEVVSRAASSGNATKASGWR